MLFVNIDVCVDLVILDRTDKVNHSQRMKMSIVKQVLKIDSSDYKFTEQNYNQQP